MKKLTLLAILTAFTAISCVEEKEWLYDRGKVSVVKCTEL